MSELPSTDYRIYPKGPNFLMIVVLAGVALIIIMILAYLLLLGAGDTLLPSAHHNGESTAQLLRFTLGRLTV